ncbi:MAG: hypothetical protein Q8M11_15035 [Sulfuritalea sp.]|nr:hypothetical protein [Sulfuritalea sp.]
MKRALRFHLHVGRELLENLAIRSSWVWRWRVERGRTTVADRDQQASKFVDQFEFFARNLAGTALRGKRMLEVGPGDAMPLALIFFGSGGERYVALDRFLGDPATPEDISILRECTLARYPSLSAAEIGALTGEVICAIARLPTFDGTDSDSSSVGQAG